MKRERDLDRAVRRVMTAKGLPSPFFHGVSEPGRELWAYLNLHTIRSEYSWMSRNG